MEPPRGPPANGAEPSRGVGTVKVYLPNKQRTVVSLMGAKLAGVWMDPVLNLGSEAYIGLGGGFCQGVGELAGAPVRL